MTREDKAICEHVEISLKEYFDMRLRELDRRVEQAFEASQLAIHKAQDAIDRRLDLLNEFRAQASDESKKYATREVTESLVTQISRIYGGMLVLGVIGIANLVKLFFH